MKKEAIGVKGVLTMEVYENNVLVNTIVDENTIVDNGYKILSSCMLGNSNMKISKLIIGDGGILNTVVKTVDPTDHDLYSRVKESTVVGASNLSNKTLSYSAYITFDVGETHLISEAGLFNNYYDMFNRKCFAEFAVNENFHLNIKWDIIFSFNV